MYTFVTRGFLYRYNIYHIFISTSVLGRGKLILHSPRVAGDIIKRSCRKRWLWLPPVPSTAAAPRGIRLIGRNFFSPPPATQCALIHTHTHTRIYKFRTAVYARDLVCVCVGEIIFSLSHSVARAKPFGNGHGIKFPLSALVHIYTHIHLCALILVYTHIYIGVISLYIDTRAKRNAAADRRADFCLGFTISIYISSTEASAERGLPYQYLPTYLPTFVFLSTSPAVTFVCFYPRLIYNKSSNRVGFIISRVPLAPKLYIYIYICTCIGYIG